MQIGAIVSELGRHKFSQIIPLFFVWHLNFWARKLRLKNGYSCDMASSTDHTFTYGHHSKILSLYPYVGIFHFFVEKTSDNLVNDSDFDQRVLSGRGLS